MMNLFDDDEKQPTRSDKMRASRKVTNELTAWAIKYLNDTKQFKVNRSNNFPSPRISRKDVVINAFDANGKPWNIYYEEVKIMFKSNNIQETILDISGFTTAENTKVGGGVHFEIEVKTGKDFLSEDQKERIAAIKAAGGISFAFKDQETFLLQIKPFLNEWKPAF